MYAELAMLITAARINMTRIGLNPEGGREAFAEPFEDGRRAHASDQRRHPHERQGDQDGDEAERVEEEADAGPGLGEYEGGEERPDEPGGVEDRRVESDSVAEVLAIGEHRWHDRLPGRNVDDVGDAEDEVQKQKLPVPRCRT